MIVFLGFCLCAKSYAGDSNDNLNKCLACQIIVQKCIQNATPFTWFFSHNNTTYSEKFVHPNLARLIELDRARQNKKHEVSQ